MSLVTLANYKAYLKIADASQDTNLTVIQTAVEKRVKNFLNRDLESATYTDEYYTGKGSNKLVLRQYPITSVASIKRYDGISSGSEIWTTLVAYTNYDRLVLDAEACYIYLDNGQFECGVDNNYKITYTAGYSSIPDDIQMACKELLKVVWDNSPINQNRLGFLNASSNAGSGSENLSIDPDIENKILKKIEHYKAINV